MESKIWHVHVVVKSSCVVIKETNKARFECARLDLVRRMPWRVVKRAL